MQHTLLSGSNDLQLPKHLPVLQYVSGRSLPNVCFRDVFSLSISNNAFTDLFELPLELVSLQSHMASLVLLEDREHVTGEVDLPTLTPLNDLFSTNSSPSLSDSLIDDMEILEECGSLMFSCTVSSPLLSVTSTCAVATKVPSFCDASESGTVDPGVEDPNMEESGPP